MTDRELLDLAAKAAGIAITWERGQDYPERIELFRGHLANYEPWNPLTDDGDNRRLQVKLCLGLVPVEGGGWDCITWDHDDEVTLAADFDPNRAIVRAAAAIQKSREAK